MRRFLIVLAALIGLIASDARADEPFNVKTFICTAGQPCTIPADYNPNASFFYVQPCGGWGANALANTYAGPPGGSRSIWIGRNLKLTPGAALTDGVNYHICPNGLNGTTHDQSNTFLKDNTGALIVSLPPSTDATAVFTGGVWVLTPGTGSLCGFSIISSGSCLDGGTTIISSCGVLTGKKASVGGPSDATILVPGRSGTCQQGTLSYSGAGASCGANGFGATNALASQGGNAGRGINGLAGPVGGTTAVPAVTAATDCQGGGGRAPVNGFQNAGNGSYKPYWTDSINSSITAGYYGGASGPAGGTSITQAGLSGFPSGGGADTATTGTTGSPPAPGDIVGVYCVHSFSIGKATFCGYPVNTGEAQVVDYNVVSGWPDNTTETAFLDVCAHRSLTPPYACPIGPTLTLGFNANAGGVNNFISFGSHLIADNFCNTDYGSTCGNAFRDDGDNGVDNPTPHSCGLSCGTALSPAFITASATDVDIAGFRGSRFYTPRMRFNWFQELSPNAQCKVTDAPCPFGTVANIGQCDISFLQCNTDHSSGNANAPGGCVGGLISNACASTIAFTNESQEIDSGWDHCDHWSDESLAFGDLIPVVLHTYCDFYMNDTTAGQFYDPRNLFTDYSGTHVYDPTSLVAHLDCRALPCSGPSTIMPDFSVMRNANSTHLDATKFTAVMFTHNGIWQTIPTVAGEFQYVQCNQDPQPTNTNYTYVGGKTIVRSIISNTCVPDGGLLIFIMGSTDPDAGTGLGIWSPEAGPHCGLNCAHTLMIKSDGTMTAANYEAQSYMQARVSIDTHHSLDNAVLIVTNSFQSGIISPTNLSIDYPADCPSMPSCRMGMVNQRYLLGPASPNLIRTVALGAAGFPQRWRLNRALRY